MFTGLDQVIPTILEVAAPPGVKVAAPAIVEKVKRREWVIKILKRLKLNPEHPPADFSGVYAHAMVAYGVDKPEPVLQVFHEPRFRNAFRQIFERQDLDQVSPSDEPVLDWRALIDGKFVGDWQALWADVEGVDLQLEFAQFSSVFLEVTARSRMPAEVVRDRKLTTLSQRLEQLQLRLDKLVTLEDLRSLVEQQVQALK